MDPDRNPYTPWEGTPPPLLAGRKKILLKAKVSIKRAPRSKKSRGQIMLGIRGTGKSVLLQRTYQMAQAKGCETIFFQADPNQGLPALLAPQVEQLLLNLDQVKSGSRDIRKAFRCLKRITAGESTGDLQAELTELLLAAGRSAGIRKKCIVILIDEIQHLNKGELGMLILSLGRAVREKMPLLLFGAGLTLPATFPGDVRAALESLSEITEVGRLGRKNAVKALVVPASGKGVEFENGAIDMVVKETGGYPGLLQAWGASLWNVAGSSPVTVEDAEHAGSMIRDKYDNGLHRALAERLTRRQLEYALAMAGLDHLPARSTDVARRLGMNVSRAAPVRDEIIGKGIAFSPGRGLITFSVPYFAEYLKRTVLFP